MNSQGRLDIYTGPMFSGKCLAKGTPVLMYNGGTKFVQDIVIGDVLAGYGTGVGRIVLSTHRGYGQMYNVLQKNGMDYSVNESHIMTIEHRGRIMDVPVTKIQEKYRGVRWHENKRIFTDITVTKAGCADYYGFTIDGDERFLLGDGTVTHNSSAMIRILVQLQELNRKVLCINHSFDTRDSATGFSTHCMLTKHANVECIKVSDLRELDTFNLTKYNVIGIDESQFFDSYIVEFVKNLVDKNKQYVIISGLDGDSNRNKFGHVLDLIPLADNVTKLHAICKMCLQNNGVITPAIFTHRHSSDSGVVYIGAEKEYESLCRDCYKKLN